MLRHDVQARVTAASDACRRLGISQAQIAEAVGASQPQVSRVLGGRGLKATRLLDEVCGFVERYESGVTADAVRANNELVEAVKVAWDGSASHARALSAVIRSLSALKAPRR